MALEMVAEAAASPGWPAWVVPAGAWAEWQVLSAALTALEPLAPVCVDDPAAWWAPGTSRAVQAEAVEWCRSCPVRAECLAYAAAAGEREGVWGGTTPGDRGFGRSR
jgi:WhiB family redox-sensing transcriptional regulator